MDAQTTFTLKEVITLIIAMGGCIGTFWTVMWQMRVKISEVKEHLDEKRQVEIAAIYDRMNGDKKELNERMDRNAATCRENERELFKDMTEIKTRMVSEKNLEDMEKRLETHVNTTVDAAISKLEAKIPQMMMDALKTFKPS